MYKGPRIFLLPRASKNSGPALGLGQRMCEGGKAPGGVCGQAALTSRPHQALFSFGNCVRFHVLTRLWLVKINSRTVTATVRSSSANRLLSVVRWLRRLVSMLNLDIVRWLRRLVSMLNLDSWQVRWWRATPARETRQFDGPGHFQDFAK